MNGVVIANEVKLYHRIAVSLRICNDCFIGPFAIIIGIFLFRSRFWGSQNAANEILCSLYEILIEFTFVVSPSNQKPIWV